MPALLPALGVRAQAPFAKYLDQVDSAPFIVVDKEALKLTLVDAQGVAIKEYGISCAVNYGPKAQLNAVLSEFRQYDGVEVVRLGSLATSALRGVVRLASKSDPDAREALALMRGIKRLNVLEYEDCTPEVRERINQKLARILSDSELLMEAKDSGETVRMYTVGSEKLINGFVLLAAEPEEVTFICLDGQMPRDDFEKLIAEQMAQ